MNSDVQTSCTACADIMSLMDGIEAVPEARPRRKKFSERPEIRFTNGRVLYRKQDLDTGSRPERNFPLAKASCTRYLPLPAAGVAQLAEQLICNQQVAGSIPIASSIFRSDVEKNSKFPGQFVRVGR